MDTPKVVVVPVLECLGAVSPADIPVPVSPEPVMVPPPRTRTPTHMSGPDCSVKSSRWLTPFKVGIKIGGDTTSGV